MRDPYAIYARHILQLRTLDPLELTFEAAGKGALLHKALEVYLDSNPDFFSPSAVDDLCQTAQELYQEMYQVSYMTGFWSHRFRRIAEWFVEQMRQSNKDKAQTWTEVSGQLCITDKFLVTAKADRIDRHANGSLHIIDYKTGSIPPVTDIRQGYSSQLALEAMIALQGGFAEIAEHEVDSLSFWQLTGRNPPGVIRTIKDAPRELATSALQGVQRLVQTFANPFIAYQSCPRPHKAPIFSDYAHLARIDEWNQGGADDPSS